MIIKAVVFDLDHTLFDRYKTIEKSCEEFCRRFESRLSESMTVQRVCDLLCEGDKLYIYNGWRRIFQYLCDEGMFSDAPQYAEYRDCMLELYSKNAVPFPFTNTLLEELRLRKYKIGLITNGQSAIQRSKIAMLGIEKYFDAIIVGGEFGIQKPDTAPFLEMARILGTAPENAVYVGDNPINDVFASANAGYTPIQVLSAKCVLEEFPNSKHCIDSVAGLLPLLEEISK